MSKKIGLNGVIIFDCELCNRQKCELTEENKAEICGQWIEDKITKICGFFRDFRFLSNFEGSAILDEIEYPTIEHGYQAAKTLDPAQREKIRLCEKPAEARRLGQTVTMRPDFGEKKIEIMEKLLEQKFSREPYKSKLLATENWYLEETNTWGDKFWGVCDGEGENNMGKLLMKIRDKIAKEPKSLEEYENILREVGCLTCGDKTGNVLIYRHKNGVELRGRQDRFWVYLECKKCKHETPLAKALARLK